MKKRLTVVITAIAMIGLTIVLCIMFRQPSTKAYYGQWRVAYVTLSGHTYPAEALDVHVSYSIDANCIEERVENEVTFRFPYRWTDGQLFIDETEDTAGFVLHRQWNGELLMRLYVNNDEVIYRLKKLQRESLDQREEEPCAQDRSPARFFDEFVSRLLGPVRFI